MKRTVAIAGAVVVALGVGVAIWQAAGGDADSREDDSAPTRRGGGEGRGAPPGGPDRHSGEQSRGEVENYWTPDRIEKAKPELPGTTDRSSEEPPGDGTPPGVREGRKPSSTPGGGAKPE